MPSSHAEDHVRILAIARALKTHLRRDEAPACAGFAQLRWTLTRELLAHISMEDRFVYARADAMPAGVREQAREHLAFSDRFRAFTRLWAGRDVRVEWARYRSEMTAILAALEARARFEDRHGLAHFGPAVGQKAAVSDRTRVPPAMSPVPSLPLEKLGWR